MASTKRNAKQRKSNTKGQIIGQVFIFILAGLVFVLIVGYGYKAVQFFLERQEQVVLLDFQSELEIAIEGVKRDYTTVRKLQLILPNKYQGVCFFDYTKPVCDPNTVTVNPKLDLPGQEIGVKWAEDACKVKSSNVFFRQQTCM